MIYFDTTYIVRLFAEDPGWERVRELAATDDVACCLHGQIEAVAAFHRKLREGEFSKDVFKKVLDEFETNSRAGAFRWLPLSPVVIDRATNAYRNTPETIFLRSGDALHLSCAAENGFKEIYSNDVRLLSAATHFGLIGLNVI